MYAETTHELARLVTLRLYGLELVGVALVGLRLVLRVVAALLCRATASTLRAIESATFAVHVQGSQRTV